MKKYPTKKFKELMNKKRKKYDEWVEIAEELAEAKAAGKLDLYENKTGE